MWGGREEGREGERERAQRVSSNSRWASTRSLAAVADCLRETAHESSSSLSRLQQECELSRVHSCSGAGDAAAAPPSKFSCNTVYMYVQLHVCTAPFVCGTLIWPLSGHPSLNNNSSSSSNKQKLSHSLPLRPHTSHAVVGFQGCLMHVHSPLHGPGRAASHFVIVS